MKTVYRIVTCHTYIADRYLQFKSTKTSRFRKKVKDVWRLVPQEVASYVLGQWLYPTSCPTVFPYGMESRFINCFDGQESYDVIPFTDNYPDIEVYFEMLRNKRNEYVIEEKLKRTDNGKVTLL